MPALCSCECERAEAIIGLFEDYHHVSDWLEQDAFSEFDCAGLERIFYQDCFVLSNQEYISEAFIFLDSLRNEDMVTEEEIDLLVDFVEDAEDGRFFIEDYRRRWGNLRTRSRFNNSFSLVVLETSSSVTDFVWVHDFIDDDDKPDAILSHIGGALWGAAAGLWIDTIADVIEYGEPQGSPFNAMRNGAIGGAIRGI